MQLNTKEFYDIMAVFEKSFRYMRMDKEPKEEWKRGNIFEAPDTNKAFSAFCKGYSLGRASYMDEGANGEHVVTS